MQVDKIKAKSRQGPLARDHHVGIFEFLKLLYEATTEALKPDRIGAIEVPEWTSAAVDNAIHSVRRNVRRAKFRAKARQRRRADATALAIADIASLTPAPTFGDGQVALGPDFSLITKQISGGDD